MSCSVISIISKFVCESVRPYENAGVRGLGLGHRAKPSESTLRRDFELTVDSNSH